MWYIVNVVQVECVDFTEGVSDFNDRCDFLATSSPVRPRRSAAVFRIRVQSEPSSKKELISPDAVGMACMDNSTGLFIYLFTYLLI